MTDATRELVERLREVLRADINPTTLQGAVVEALWRHFSRETAAGLEHTTRIIFERAALLSQALNEIERLLDVCNAPWGPDTPDEYSAAIDAAHPLVTGRGEQYQIALKMVGNRRDKYGLVNLVHWLLEARAQEREACAQIADKEAAVFTKIGEPGHAEIAEDIAAAIRARKDGT